MIKVKVQALDFLVVLTFIISVLGRKSDSSLIVSESEPNSFQYACGDIVMSLLWGMCSCGSELIYPFVFMDGGFETVYYCCTPPSVKCKKTFYGALCSEGQVLEIFHSHNQGDI